MKKRQTISAFIILLGILMIFFWLPESRAIFSKGEIRAAMDIGSGATNLKIAKVDPKTDKIIVQLFEKSIAVPYQKHLEQSTTNTFDQEVMDQGIQAIKSLKEVAETYHVKKVIAVATEAFRKAANANQFAAEIQKQTGVDVRIINQDEEGILAFRGALALSSIKPAQAIVWDIGGGSMQLTLLSKEGTYLIEKGKTASIPFKNAVIQEIKHDDPAIVHSPNPMTVEQMQAAIDLSSKYSLQTDQFIRNSLLDPQMKILAVGNLFNYGIRPLVDDKIVKSGALEESVMKKAGKTDAELPGGALSEVAVTNPLLVLGYMKGLHINSVEVVNVNNADGALTYPPYWEEAAITPSL